MKVEMELVRSPTHRTKALTPKRPLMIDERWVDRLEKLSKGKLRRKIVPAAEVSLEEETTLPRRRRRTGSGITAPIEE